MKWALGERREGETFHPGWAVLGLRSCFVPEAAAGLRAVYEFRIDGEALHARVDDGAVEMAHGPAQRPDAVIAMDEPSFLALAAGRSALGELIEDGSATASGDPRVLSRLGGLFRLPRPRSRTPESPAT